MSDEILTIRQVAEYLKVTEKTVYGLAQKRAIPGFKVGGQWRFRREDLDAWIAAQTADATPGHGFPPPVESDDKSSLSQRRRTR